MEWGLKLSASYLGLCMSPWGLVALRSEMRQDLFTFQTLMHKNLSWYMISEKFIRDIPEND